MPTALLATALVLPPDLVEVRAGDVDQDGRDELVLVGRHDRGAQPDAVTLTVVHFAADGREEGRDSLALGNEALLWDIEGGLWAVDGDGVLRLGLDGSRSRLAELRTPLSGLGPATPIGADIAHDLDGDGAADVLLFSRGALQAVAADGRKWGAVAAPAEGALSSRSIAGGTGLVAAASMPAVAVGDVDGDGRSDLLLPARDQVRLAITGDALGTSVRTAALPMDLEPPRARDVDPESEERRVAGAWFRDLTGDGKVDLLVQRAITNGSWFGATADFTLATGTGTSFPVVQALETEAAAIEVELLDFEGDGDVDLLVTEIDANMGNLASALVAKVVKIQPVLYVMEGGRYGAPVHLDKLKVPLDRGERLQLEVGHDIDGDGIVDLVSNGGEDQVRVHLGHAYGFAAEPAAQVDVPVPAGQDTLFVRDLTGDGRAEIVVWGRGRTAGHLLRLP